MAPKKAPPKEPEPEEEPEPEPGSVPVPPSLAWTDLTLTEIRNFMQKATPEESLTFIAEKFQLTDYESNAQSSIMVDFYLWILTFTKESGFNEEKASAAFTIVKKTHEFALSDGGKQIQETFEVFRRMVLQHALTGVPGSVVLFTPEDVKLLTAYVTQTYMQHYRLYQFCHRHPQELDCHSTCLFVSTASTPAPLRLAIDEEEEAEKAAAAAAAAQAAQEAAQQPAEGEGVDKENSEGTDGGEKSDEARVAEAVAKVLEAKGKLLEQAIDDKMKVKLSTLDKKLAGMGM